MRNRFGYNSQVVNWGGFNELMPCGYIDVLPGETIQGSVNLAVRSQPTTLAVDTRAYVDAYAFYVPYRLLWDEFPKFVSGQTSAAIPYVSNLWPFNYETRFTVDSTGVRVTANANMPWQRYAFNVIWNQFFRRADQAERALTDNTLTYVSQRASTMEKRPLLGTAGTFNTQIPLSGVSPNQTLGTNVFRTYMAADRFGRMRAMYGNKYVDYLRSLGVEVEWSLLDEPEVLAKVSKDWRFMRVSQTAPAGGAPPQDTVGQQAGTFFTTIKLPVKRTFIPEHGMLCFYTTTRADGVYQNPPMPIMACKWRPSHYWSPEYETLAGGNFGGDPTLGPHIPDQVFEGVTGVTLTYNWKPELYEEYRTGLNYNRPIANGPEYALKLVDGNSVGPTKYVAPTQNDYSNNFTQATAQQYQMRAEYRLTRNSPVKRVSVISSPPLV